MKTFKLIHTLLVAGFFMFSPISSYGQYLAETDRAMLTQLQKDVSPYGMEVDLDYKNGKAVLTKPASKTSAAATIEIPLSSESDLRKFSPKAMKAKIEAAMSTPQLSSAALNSLRRLPVESGLFYLAIGGVMATKLLTDFSANPNSLEQHNHHSLSPIGIMSFYGFMVANGVASNVLIATTKNPKMYHFIPYLGMTAGFFTQSAISMFASDPNVKACAKTMMYTSLRASDEQVKNLVGESVADPCEAAFNKYVIGKQLMQLAPGLVSMLGSTVIAGMVTKYGAKAAKIKNLEFLFYVFPGGVQVKGLRAVVGSVTQMTLFVGLDTLFLNRMVTEKFNKVVNGQSLYNSEVALEKSIIEKHKNGWKDSLNENSCSNKSVPTDCQKDLAFQLTEFSEKANTWRSTTLAPVYEAQQAWSEYLAKLTTGYNTTHEFYASFVDQVRAHRLGTARDRLAMKYPLMGVPPSGLNPTKGSLVHTDPQFVEGMQVEAIHELVPTIEKMLQHKIDNHMTGAYPKETRFLREVLPLFKSDSVEQISQGIELFNSTYARAHNVKEQYSKNFMIELEYLRNQIGQNARPTNHFGEGFVETFRLFSMNSKNYEELKSPGITALGKTASYMDHLVVQSACGPVVSSGKSESLISNGWGFPSEFHPPRLTSEIDLGISCLAITHNSLMKSSVYSQKLPGANGFAEYTAKNILPAVLGNNESSGFEDWWNQSAAVQMNNAFKIYEDKYSNIIAKLMNALKASNPADQEKADREDIPALSAKILTSLNQQARIYTMILGDIFKTTYKEQIDAQIPMNLYNSKEESVPAAPVYDFAPPSFYLLETVKKAPVFSIEKALSISTAGHKSIKAKSYPLQLQAEIDYEFQMLNWYIDRISLKENKETKSYRIETSFENQEIEEQYNKFRSKVLELSGLMGISDKANQSADQSEGLVRLSKEQKLVAEKSVELLLAAAEEIVLYGTIINAVSWDKIQRLNGITKEMDDKRLKQIETKAKELGGSLSSRSGGTNVDKKNDVTN